MNSIVGHNLKLLREANRLTQENVADYLGIGHSIYAIYEAGEKEAPIEVLESVCQLFGCELNLLFCEDERELHSTLVSAFRTENLCVQDMREIAAFKNMVMNYIKMQRVDK